MFKCTVCGREFPSPQALGGHMSTAPGHGDRTQHGDRQNEPQLLAAPNTPESPQEEVPPGTGAVPEQTPEAPPEVDESTAAEIREKIGRGYNFEQLTKQFGYAPRSVRREMEKFIQPAESSAVPATYKRTDVLEPEALLRRYTDGSYEDKIELRGMMKLRAAMLLVADMINLRKGEAEAFALEVKPVLDLMKETRAEQDAAAERARGSNLDIARETAQETAARVAAIFEERGEQRQQQKVDIATTPNPLAAFMGRALEGMWNQVTAKIFGVTQPGQSQLPPGWRDLRTTEGK